MTYCCLMSISVGAQQVPKKSLASPAKPWRAGARIFLSGVLAFAQRRLIIEQEYLEHRKHVDSR